MKSVMFSTARKSFANLCDSVTADKTTVEIVRRDKPSVVVIDKEEYEGLQETLHLLSTPSNAANLLNSIGELESGESIEFDPLTDPLP